jgi:hypothetical protein
VTSFRYQDDFVDDRMPSAAERELVMNEEEPRTDDNAALVNRRPPTPIQSVASLAHEPREWEPAFSEKTEREFEWDLRRAEQEASDTKVRKCRSLGSSFHYETIA